MRKKALQAFVGRTLQHLRSALPGGISSLSADWPSQSSKASCQPEPSVQWAWGNRSSCLNTVLQWRSRFIVLLYSSSEGIHLGAPQLKRIAHVSSTPNSLDFAKIIPFFSLGLYTVCRAPLDVETMGAAPPSARWSGFRRGQRSAQCPRTARALVQTAPSLHWPT